jgi:murein DD-endopeptidase MepM/ murein hydrolase activator NlpD
MNRPLNDLVLRGVDPTGNGWYGASRGSRDHKGVDYIGVKGEDVFACISGKVRVGRVYKDPVKKKFKLVEITKKMSMGRSGRVKQMYVNPTVSTGDIVQAGDKIGTLQGIGTFYGGGMPDHCHVSVWKNGLLTDPEPLIK